MKNTRYFFLEIWTNGSLTPKEALYEASRNLIDLFLAFLHVEEEGMIRLKRIYNF
jgi:DNA-directed RNA polymerase subunit alpha